MENNFYHLYINLNKQRSKQKKENKMWNIKKCKKKNYKNENRNKEITTKINEIILFSS